MKMILSNTLNVLVTHYGATSTDQASIKSRVSPTFPIYTPEEEHIVQSGTELEQRGIKVGMYFGNVKIIPDSGLCFLVCVCVCVCVCVRERERERKRERERERAREKERESERERERVREE